VATVASDDDTDRRQGRDELIAAYMTADPTLTTAEAERMAAAALEAGRGKPRPDPRAAAYL
jgi:hypothetical protein